MAPFRSRRRSEPSHAWAVRRLECSGLRSANLGRRRLRRAIQIDRWRIPPTTSPAASRLRDVARDTLAGVIVGIVALPLAIAFAIASGVSPAQGLATAIVAGFLISALGGSRVQIGGPTGTFVVIVYGVVQRHGVEGLALATLIAGVLLLVMGFARLGAVIQFVTYHPSVSSLGSKEPSSSPMLKTPAASRV